MHNNLCTPHIIHGFQKRADEVCKFIGNYIYYRKRNHSHSMAWSMARNTL